MCMLLLVASCSLGVSAASTKKVNQWVTIKGNTYWYDGTGKFTRNKIKKIQGKYYSFDSTGKLRKNQYIVTKKYVYRAGKSGALYTGWKTLSGKKYYFNSKGRVLPGIHTIGGKTYCFSEKGKMLTGWQLVDGKKYYFHSKTEEMVTNRKINGIKINKKGVAPLTEEDKLTILAQDIVENITNSSMTKQQKLQACFSYMTNKSRFSYITWRDFSYYKDWHVDWAYEMLTTNMGNCYNFASAFAYLAKAVGYDPILVRGRIHGTRDGASDGLTRHCWVLINGLYYDPEGVWKGFDSVCGDSVYPLVHQVQGYDPI